jgi:hypothetical protein
MVFFPEVAFFERSLCSYGKQNELYKNKDFSDSSVKMKQKFNPMSN